MSRREFPGFLIAMMTIPILATGNPGAASSGSGKIVFVKREDRFANDQICTMNSDGSDMSCFWSEPGVPGYVFHLAMSPDGRKIAFFYNRDGTPEHIYVINADGSNLTRLAGTEGGEEDPSFSPDGSKIVFSCQGKPKTIVVPNLGSMLVQVFQICIMNADGSNAKYLTDSASEHKRPMFSPDGKKIAFSSTGEAGQQIYMMDADGANVTRLTNLRNSPLFGGFSPDGSKIVFSSGNVTLPSSPGVSPTISGEIYVMNVDGSNVTRLISRSGLVREPTYSPDGSKIAFTVESELGEDNFQICVMNADGSNLTQVTNPPEIHRDPVFLP